MNSRPGAAITAIAALVAIGIAVALIFSRRPAPVPPTRVVPVPETSRSELAQHDGRWFHNSETNPFTGIMVDLHPDGKKMSRVAISNGLLNGLSESWYTNGQVQTREFFKNGVSDGPREKWHEDGRKLSQAMIVAGKVNGTFQRWHDNGQLAEQIEMTNGEPADGISWAYYPSGCVKARTTVSRGKVLEQKVWKDGEQPHAQ